MTTAIARVQNFVRPLHWRIASTLPERPRRHYLHLARTGKPGNFTTPRTFNEKVNWRILNDRSEMITRACDKQGMKEMARERISDEALLRIPRTLWLGSDRDQLPDLATLPPWIAKPNSGSGDVLIGPATQAELEDRVQDWLHSKQADQLGEWGYEHARSGILIEELIPSDNGVPEDYKFFVYDGVPHFIQVNSGRFSGDFRCTMYNPQWEKLDARWRSVLPGDEPRPANLDAMLEVASRLGEGWDFIRVDLYSVGDQIWFGEYTPYPGGGVMNWRPREFNLTLGMPWRIPG